MQNIPGYYAIGDVNQQVLLTFPAEGINCVEKIAGMHVEPSITETYRLYLRYTWNCFVFKTERKLQIKIGKFFSASESKSSGTPDESNFNKKYVSG
jgi:dihydrolipoamide dehydrogenase